MSELTVRQLVLLLQTFNQDKPVYVEDWQEQYSNPVAAGAYETDECVVITSEYEAQEIHKSTRREPAKTCKICGRQYETPFCLDCYDLNQVRKAVGDES